MGNVTASACVRDGRLCIVGLHDSSETGPIPFAYTTPVEAKDGPIDIGAENLDPKVVTALEKAKGPMRSTIEDEQMKTIAEQWVERARAGDQNAMALISGVRQNAIRGVDRAKKASKFLGEYIRSHPVDLTKSHEKYLPANVGADRTLIQKLSKFNGDDAAVSAWTPALGKTDQYVTALILADGPQLTFERMDSIGSHFGEDQKDFVLGVRSWDIKEPIRKSDAFIAGKAIGNARALQGVRTGACPVSTLSRVAGWELGE